MLINCNFIKQQIDHYSGRNCQLQAQECFAIYCGSRRFSDLLNDEDFLIFNTQKKRANERNSRRCSKIKHLKRVLNVDFRTTTYGKYLRRLCLERLQ